MKKDGLTYRDLTIDMPVKLQRITELKIEQSLNNHAVAHITGILKEENHDAIHSLTDQTNIKIKAQLEDKEEIIFSGIPVKVTIKKIDGVYHIHMILNSTSIYLDIQQKSRSFQNPNNPYENLLKTILREYRGDIFDSATKGALQNCCFIQYQETDWEFIKRVASHTQAPIFPEIASEEPRIYIGINIGNNYEEKNPDYTIEKNLKNYLHYTKNHGDRYEQEDISYWIESMGDYQLGDKITYQKIPFTVAQKVTEIKKGILIHKYRLQKETGLKQSILYNKKLKGTSIQGKALAVEKDKLKLHLSIDASQDTSTANWYPFDTVYTTEGTTGWYSMPQIGDTVQLYMPTENEKEAYVKKVMRLDGETNPKVQDPSIKYYGTVHQKEMKLAPKELTLSAVENQLYLKMNNETGIEVNSHQDIHIKTQKQLIGECETIEIESKDKILLATKTCSIIVDDIVHIKG
ncbi:Phage late control gene D protein (GPD) [Anaerovirgula multivorans]|uniref:Phage late control gene D protein (GPD) n=1 Tax=Anaerovirgula multivorans TaxID=312168 RepID=A0A239FK12_9FIRM|nr:hypothetical protein [Anaerovirgula multivorans]SNS56562.1 Phage late control gene D protein (GPD) [Anaerovirgula multivorans]